MTLAKITTPGLTAMGLSVALLWSCLIGERILARQAAQGQAQVLREMNLLRQRQRAVPASIPLLPFPLRGHVARS